MMPYLPDENAHMAPFVEMTGNEFATKYGFSSSTGLRLNRVIYQVTFSTMCIKF